MFISLHVYVYRYKTNIKFCPSCCGTDFSLPKERTVVKFHSKFNTYIKQDLGLLPVLKKADF